MRGRTLVVALMMAGAVWAGAAVPALAGGAGGMFVDVDPAHRAINAIRNLVNRGIIEVDASGEFRGGEPLLRYDAALWLDRLIRDLEGASPTGDVESLTGRVSTLESRTSTLTSDISRLSSDVQSLKATVATLERDVRNLKDTGLPSPDLAGRVQTNFILGVTAVVLSVAALGVAIFFSG